MEYALDSFQQVGARWLAERTEALLADEPGVGKTPQLVVGLNLTDARRVGVIAPASGVVNWRREIDRWGSGLWQAQVVSYDKAETLKPGYDSLIVDEAHYLKTPTSGRTQAIYGPTISRRDGLIGPAKRVWLATGTPMPNNALELWPHLHALFPHLIPRKGHPGPTPQDIWTRQTCVTEPSRYGTRRVVCTKASKIPELNAILAQAMLRRLKKDVYADMPELRFTDLALDVDLDESLFQDEIDVVREAVALGGWDAVVDLEPETSTLRRYTALAKVRPSIAWIKEWLTAHPGEKIVVFAVHTQVLDALQKAFGNDCVRLDGSTVNRQKPVDEFQSGAPRVFLGQMTAAGTVITLTRSQTVFFLESDWVPANISQAAQRVHRRGTDKPCIAYLATAPDTIDEAVQRTLVRKTREITGVVDGARGEGHAA